MRIRKSVVAWALAPAVAVAGTVVSAAAAAPVPALSASQAQGQVLPWSSADIVKGVFFYDGPVVPVLPKQYYSTVPAITSDQREVINELIAEIDKRTPGTTQLLKDAFQSGSPVQVKEAIKAVAHELGEVAKTSSDAQRLITPDCAAFLIALVFGFVYYLAEVWTVEAAVSSAAKADTVDQERFVADLIHAFQTA
ncbi:MAG TPA: hypothetical protein VF821_03750 [Lentzea sp.]